jgi:hypothetical protein
MAPALLSNTEPAKDHPQQIIRRELTGDRVQLLLRQSQLLGK